MRAGTDKWRPCANETFRTTPFVQQTDDAVDAIWPAVLRLARRPTDIATARMVSYFSSDGAIRR